MVSFGSTTYSKRLLHLISWSHWFTFFNIIAAIILSSFYLFNEVTPETTLGMFYLITTWLSHMGFLTFIGFVLLIFPLTLIYPKTRFIRGSASVIYTIGMLLLLLDAFIYSRLGYHLNASSSDQILALISTQIEQNSRVFWFSSILLFISILVFQLVVSNYAWKHLRELQKTIFARYIVIGLVVSFFFSHILHIWADANLEYDILRQDTVLPLSYPSTAKTLLTKYGMFNKQDYLARRTSPLSFTETIPTLPAVTEQCKSITTIEQSAILVFTEKALSNTQIKRFEQRIDTTSMRLTKHIDNALPNESLFNTMYSLPSIYNERDLVDNSKPLLFSLLELNNLTSSLTIIGHNDVQNNNWRPYNDLFTSSNTETDISNLVLSSKLRKLSPGLHVYFFHSQDHYQYELFIEALLHAQRSKATKDYLWFGSIGNQESDSALSIKPALLVLPNKSIAADTQNLLTSQFDLQPTLIKNWLNCKVDSVTYSAGQDIVSLKNNRVIANTTNDGIVVFNKDKSISIDQNGNFQSYSRQLDAPITVNPDFPLMIDGVNFIKRFATKNKTVQ